MRISARREQRINNLDQGKKSNYFAVVIVAIVIGAALLIKSFLTPNSERTISVAYVSDDGGAEISLYDFQAETISTIILPPNTVVDMSNQRGEWKLESVPKLIESEGLAGEVFAGTLMRSLAVPIDKWAFHKPESVQDAFTLPKTNLSLVQRVQLYMFEKNLRPSNKKTIDLADTQYLSKSELADGQEGFVLGESKPRNIIASFSDPNLVASNLRVKIEAKGGVSSKTANIVSDIIETLGANVVAIEPVSGEYKTSAECGLFTKSKDHSLDRVSNLFNCWEAALNSETNLDAILLLNEDFIKKF